MVMELSIFGFNHPWRCLARNTKGVKAGGASECSAGGGYSSTKSVVMIIIRDHNDIGEATSDDNSNNQIIARDKSTHLTIIIRNHHKY